MRRRWAVMGLLGGIASALLLLGIYFVAARTSLNDRLHGHSPSWRPAGFPPAEQYAAAERRRYSPTDPMFREAGSGERPAVAASRGWWGLVPADRLDSLPNVALLAAVFAVGGLLFGVAWGRLVRRPIGATVAEPASEAEGAP
ncbi:MAG: hypothetical protein ISS72_07420 [Candidatus Brocadiae bacterium]|nr:hypothetical protein [Candidatus Brocadiia bacterium]